MRVIVVGSGVVGLLTAVECARAGAQVELFEQGSIPHPAAASHDRHRVVRALHRGQIRSTLAATGLDAAWTGLEHLLGGSFYHRSGVLTVLSPADLEPYLMVLHGAGVAAEPLAAAELARRYPFLRFEPDRVALFEPNAGTIRADLALETATTWLRGRTGPRLHPYRRVTSIGRTPVVHLDNGQVVHGDAVVVAAGPWSQALLPTGLAHQLSLKKQTMLAYRPGANLADWAGAPAVLGLGPEEDAWLMPPVAGTPATLSASWSCRTVPALDADEADDRWQAGLLREFERVLAGFDLAGVEALVEGHYLTDESGQGPLLAQLGDDAVWAYAACGGMSFKFAPMLARALADRALGRPVRPIGLSSVDEPDQWKSGTTTFERPELIA